MPLRYLHYIRIKMKITLLLASLVLGTGLVSPDPTFGMWNQGYNASESPVLSFAKMGHKVFASQQSGPLVYTSDGGRDWWFAGSESGDFPAILSIGQRLLAATYGKIMLSTDSGVTFQSITKGLPSANIRSLASNGGRLFAGTDKGVYRSEDSGNSWMAASNGLIHDSVTSLMVDGGALYAGSMDGFLSSTTDNGLSWQMIDTVEGVGQSVTTLAVCGRNMFAGTLRKVFRSSDSGKSWKAVYSVVRSYDRSVGGPMCIRGFATFGSSGIDVGTLEGIFRSTNSGDKWDNLGGTIDQVSGFAAFGNDEWAGTQSGIIWWSIGGITDEVPHLLSAPTLLQISPNPSTGRVQIQLASGESLRDVNVTNLLGQTVFHSEQAAAPSAVIDLSGLPTAVYYVTVSSVDGSVHGRVITQ